jgi:hypothetical protein
MRASAPCRSGSGRLLLSRDSPRDAVEGSEGQVSAQGIAKLHRHAGCSRRDLSMRIDALKAVTPRQPDRRTTMKTKTILDAAGPVTIPDDLLRLAVGGKADPQPKKQKPKDPNAGDGTSKGGGASDNGNNNCACLADSCNKH